MYPFTKTSITASTPNSTTISTTTTTTTTSTTTTITTTTTNIATSSITTRTNRTISDNIPRNSKLQSVVPWSPTICSQYWWEVPDNPQTEKGLFGKVTKIQDEGNFGVKYSFFVN